MKDLYKPPKDLHVEVRVKESLGEVMTSSGPVMLSQDTVTYLPREDVEQYIREGKLEHIS